MEDKKEQAKEKRKPKHTPQEKTTPDSTTKEQYLRLYAEFDNYKKRTRKEQLRWIEQANKRLLKKLLPILSDLEKAQQPPENATEEQIKKYEGIELIYKKLLKLLTKEGIEPIETTEGDPFNPTKHQALATMPNSDPKATNTIAQIISKGYKLQEKILQHTQVIVKA